MTLDEAIEYEKESLQHCKRMLEEIYEDNLENKILKFEVKQHEHLVEWLEDYKHIKQWKSDIMDEFCKYDVSSFEELVTNARNKAIDDFVKKISESNQGHWRVTRYEHGEAVSETMSYDIGTIRLIAEQLKAGATND